MASSAKTSKRHPIQVNETTYQKIRELASSEGESIAKVVERAVEHYRQEKMLLAHNEEWARLMNEEPETIAALEAEHRLWDSTIADGLENDPWDSE